MSSNRITLKPSLLIGASISRTGGLTNSRMLLDESLDGQHEVKKWEVTRDVPNLEELQKADAVASECRRMLSKVCYRTGFGTVCPKDREGELVTIFKEIRVTIDNANVTLVGCKLSASFVRGEITTDDQEAAKAIGADISGFLQTLADAIGKADVKAIKQTLLQMKGIEQLLPVGQSETLTKAINQARTVAKTIAAEVVKKGRQIEDVKTELQTADIDLARAAFLEVDLGEPEALTAPVVEYIDRRETVEV
jgi:hypothetical protein